MVALLVTGLGSAAGVQARISWRPRRSAIGQFLPVAISNLRGSE